MLAKEIGVLMVEYISPEYNREITESKYFWYNSPANYIPDLMIYDSNSKEVKGSRKISKLGILE